MRHHRHFPRKALIASLIVFALVACEGRTLDGYSIPPDRAGSPAYDIGPAGFAPIDRQDGVGAFRTNCERSHYRWDDPIVKPGQPNESHLHMFFGATEVNANTTDPATAPASTCEGGLANRTAYWVPAMIDTADGDKVIDAADLADALQIYYKTTHYDGAHVDPADVVPFPPGLRMIAGNGNGTQLDTRRVWWTCQPEAHIDGGQPKFDHIPPCPAGHLVQLSVEFPQCWNGNDLDSPDHKSHMAYGLGWPDLGCPTDYPVAVPAITQHIRWTSTGDTSGWRISSDVSTTATGGGYSAHADWWNGWDPSIQATWVERCLNPALDCQMNVLGDGRELS